MRDDQLFAFIASLALLIWLGGRRFLPTAHARRRAEMFALVLVGAGIAYALFRTVLWFGT
ncbi:MAG: hypothetical protein AB7I59_10335 [Geminicoccaceae bacterium]